MEIEVRRRRLENIIEENRIPAVAEDVLKRDYGALATVWLAFLLRESIKIDGCRVVWLPEAIAKLISPGGNQWMLVTNDGVGYWERARQEYLEGKDEVDGELLEVAV